MTKDRKIATVFAVGVGSVFGLAPWRSNPIWWVVIVGLAIPVYYFYWRKPPPQADDDKADKE